MRLKTITHSNLAVNLFVCTPRWKQIAGGKAGLPLRRAGVQSCSRVEFYEEDVKVGHGHHRDCEDECS